MPDQTTVTTGEVLSGQNQKILMSVDTRISVLDTKFDYMARDIKSLSDGMIERITKNESHDDAQDIRIDVLEKNSDRSGVMLRTVVIVVGGLCTFLGALITFALNVFKIIKP